MRDRYTTPQSRGGHTLINCLTLSLVSTRMHMFFPTSISCLKFKISLRNTNFTNFGFLIYLFQKDISKIYLNIKY